MILRRTSRYIRAPIDKFGWYGLWIRHCLLKYILDGTPVLLALQNRRTPFRTTVMSFFSFLGTEDCFTCMIPLLTWILDARLGRLFTILLSIGFYFAGFFKCFFCLPRPPSPPVTPVHNEVGDWAFPSNHGTVGVLLPWYLCIYSFLHYDWWPWWARTLMFVLAFSWFCGVTVSRLYLGVHSLADMVAGAVAGVWILAIFVLMDDYIDYQCAAGEYVVPKAVILANLLLYIHPRTNPETNSYGESVILTGSTVGIVASRTLTFSAHGRYSLVQSLNQFSDLTWQALILRSFLRLIIGTTMIIGGRIILKPFLRNLCYKFYAYFEVPAYSYKDHCQQYPPRTKHYTDAYRLPPLSGFSTPTSSFDDDCGDDGDDGDLANTQGAALVNGLERRKENGEICHSSFDDNVVAPRKSSLRNGCPGVERRTTKAASASASAAAAVRFEEKPELIEDSSDDDEKAVADGSSDDSLDDEVDALPYDVDIPSRFIVYSLLGWVLGEGAPAVFDLLGI